MERDDDEMGRDEILAAENEQREADVAAARTETKKSTPVMEAYPPMDDTMASIVLSEIVALDRKIERLAQETENQLAEMMEKKESLVVPIEEYLRRLNEEDPTTVTKKFPAGEIRLRKSRPSVLLKPGTILESYKDNPYIKTKIVYSVNKEMILRQDAEFTYYEERAEFPDCIIITKGELFFSYSPHDEVEVKS